MNRRICPICLKVDFLIEKPGFISPFLRLRLGIVEQLTKSLFCKKCEFIFSERALTNDEVRRLYSGYRGTEYNTQRLSVEPDYAKHIAVFEDYFSDYMLNRAAELQTLLMEFSLQPSKILDFGGDGRIPQWIFPSAEVFIDDTSEGSTDSPDNKYDLIFASEVFEHLTDPRENICDLRNRLRSKGILVIDVPMEYSPPIFAAWQKQSRDGGSLLYMHEHINHFSLKSLSEMAHQSNLDVSSVSITKMNYQVLIAKKNSFIRRYIFNFTFAKAAGKIKQLLQNHL